MRLTAILLLCAAALRGQQSKKRRSGLSSTPRAGARDAVRQQRVAGSEARRGALRRRIHFSPRGPKFEWFCVTSTADPPHPVMPTSCSNPEGRGSAPGPHSSRGPGECGLPPLARRIDPVRQHADVPLNVTDRCAAGGRASPERPARRRPCRGRHAAYSVRTAPPGTARLRCSRSSARPPRQRTHSAR